MEDKKNKERRVVVKPSQLNPDEIKSPASPTRQDEMLNIINKNQKLHTAKMEEVEDFESQFIRKSNNQQIQTLSKYAVDTNKDMTLDFSATNHDVSILLFTVPSGMVLRTKKLILANTDVTDVASMAYLNSISFFHIILGVTSYGITSSSGQILPYYTLTPFSYYNGNIIADFEMEIPQNTPMTIYGKYTDAFVTAMNDAGTTDIQYHFNVRLLGQLTSVVGG